MNMFTVKYLPFYRSLYMPWCHLFNLYMTIWNYHPRNSVQSSIIQWNPWNKISDVWTLQTWISQVVSAFEMIDLGTFLPGIVLRNDDCFVLHARSCSDLVWILCPIIISHNSLVNWYIYIMISGVLWYWRISETTIRKM